MRRAARGAFAVTAIAVALGCAAPSPVPGSPDGAAPGGDVAAPPASNDPGEEKPVPGPGDELRDAHGRVEKVSDDWWGLVADGEVGSRYAPEGGLAQEFRQDGLRVVFSGVVGEIPPNVRMWGTPLRVTKIAGE